MSSHLMTSLQPIYSGLHITFAQTNYPHGLCSIDGMFKGWIFKQIVVAHWIEKTLSKEFSWPLNQAWVPFGEHSTKQVLSSVLGRSRQKHAIIINKIKLVDTNFILIATPKKSYTRRDGDLAINLEMIDKFKSGHHSFDYVTRICFRGYSENNV